MNLTPLTPLKNKRQRGRPKSNVNQPSFKEAKEAIDLIKEKQEENDEEKIKEEQKKRELQKQQEIIELEKKKIQEVQEKIKKKLRENLEKKEIEEKRQNIINYLESGKKIKWKLVGDKLYGHFKNKLSFQIIKGLTLYSLYIKDEDLMTIKKLKHYNSCSTNIQKLKIKAENLI